jgi:hypothetical protein
MQKFALVTAASVAALATLLAFQAWVLLPRLSAVTVAVGFAPLIWRVLKPRLVGTPGSRAPALAVGLCAVVAGAAFALLQNHRLSRQTDAAIAAAEAYKARYGQDPKHLADAGVQVDDGPVHLAYLNEGSPFMWYDLGIFDGKEYRFANKSWGSWPE